MQRLLFLIFIFLVQNCLFAQNNLFRDTSLQVLENNIEFKYAWAGGLNAAQFNEIDLDLDGVKDLLIFDRSGNKLIPFLKKNNSFIYAPSFKNKLPKLKDWVILADYDCDGKNDIFSYSTSGISIYKNTSASSLDFTLVTPLVFSQYPVGSVNIFVSPVDIPAISDIDGDGDLDILTFKITGGFIEFHKNMSIELTGSCDTVAFQLESGCWGNFYEGLNNYTLNCQNCQCPPIIGNSSFKQKHAGSTLLCLDIDNDNDKDIVLGDVSFNNLNLLVNGGDSLNANMISIDSLFPSNNNNTLAASMDIFPAAFYLDVSHDGIKDLIVTSNSENNSENFESSWFYTNNGTNTNPDFNYIQKNFLQEDMIDLGAGSYPIFFDHNNDGLEDLIVGNYGYHQSGGNPSSKLALFTNTGTVLKPNYVLENRDWQNLSQINLNTNLNIPALNLIPAFGDLDDDSDQDMILGDANGKIHYFINNGTNPASFTISQPNYSNIDIGYFASPQIIDVNRDGLLDLLIGEQDGTINYCQNSGSLNSPIFDTVITNFGGIDIESDIISSGYSSPTLFDNNGSYELYSGSFSGVIYKFNNIDNNLTGVFDSISPLLSSEGSKTRIAIKDINNDQKIDCIIGNYSGGLSFFSSDSSLVSTQKFIPINNLNIYPNPAQYEIIIEGNSFGDIDIVNSFGQTIIKSRKKSVRHSININQLTRGIYFMKLGTNSSKFIIK